MTTQFPTSTPPQTHKRLTRSSTDSWIGGVCGGLAEYLGWNANLVRILFVASCLLPGPQFLLYIALWIIIPKK
ncbi:PspC domain-containing protein [Nocardia concava]|uniref:PspC domain-containing protein n=1 Tax=Nocardia concava TaxID=257281 RepID=UPI0005934D5A|nr:PspC domain-containing protein [Nocardia concava]